MILNKFLGILSLQVSVKTLSNTNSVASRHIKGEKGPHPVNVCCSKTSLKLPNVSCLASPGKWDLATYNAKMEGRVGKGTLKLCVKREGWDKGTQTSQYPVSRGQCHSCMAF